MDGINKNLEFLCCFCNTEIESSKFNPVDINLLINIDKPKDLQYSQTFYCHLECFHGRLHDSMKNYLYLKSLVDE